MLIKQADWWETTKRYAPFAAIMAAPFVINKIIDIGNNALHQSIKDVIKDDKTSKKDFEAIVQKSKEIGNIKSIPHHTLPGFNNAAYVKPNTIPLQMHKDFKVYAKNLLKSLTV